jgi:hypothetical protein
VAPTPGLGQPGSPRVLTIRPRSATRPLEISGKSLPTGETAVIITTGVILTVSSPDGVSEVLDIEADRLVAWSKGDTQKLVTGLQSGGDAQKHDDLEFYLAGNVEIRTQQKTESRVLRADEAYYDVKRHVAVALHADLEIINPLVANPFHLKAQLMEQLNENLVKAFDSETHASVLPADPGLKIATRETTLEAQVVTPRTILGTQFIDLKTGQPLVETEHYFRSRSVFLDLEGVPIFYSPYLAGDVEHPLGPLVNVGVSYNTIFGFQLFTTFDVYQLLGITKIPDTRWHLDVDYLSLRGPAVGTDFDFNSKCFLGIPGRYTGEIKAYGIDDKGLDVLGGNRGQQVLVSNNPVIFENVTHPELRGRFMGQINAQDLPNGFMYQAKINAISDHFFIEQYFLPEYQTAPNLETFFYVKQQQDFWAWDVLVEPNIRNWVTETEWLPKLEGYALGVDLFDLLTYNAKASAGYARLRTTDPPPPPYFPTDVAQSTVRGDLWQDISLPFALGAFKIVPYGVLDLTYYSADIADQQIGRVYGGGGVMASFPLSRLYPDVCSELFNVHGIFHKIVFTGNFYDAGTNVHINQLPQLDRLNDDIADETLRDMFLWQALLNPTNATLLTTSPIYNPQFVALRELVLSKVDTRDDIEVIQADIYQRWQTKRGAPGHEHVVDWMTLDLSASFYPAANRDNFGSEVAFLQYLWAWHIGDRTSLESWGWLDPESGGPRVFTIGTNINRPDRTSFYLGYRQLDPLNSKAVIGSMTFAFSAKYAVTASTVYDFGVKNETLSLMFTRIGTDIQLSMGFSYNSILSTFGFQFEILPTLLANRVHAPLSGAGLASPGSLGH